MLDISFTELLIIVISMACLSPNELKRITNFRKKMKYKLHRYKKYTKKLLDKYMECEKDFNRD